jgi:hypothetical protein
VWLKTNGEAIYATRARRRNYAEGDSVRFTRKRQRWVYVLHGMAWAGAT